MKRSPVDEMYPYIRIMRRNYDDWPYTASRCPNEGCHHIARGVEICPYCAEKKLAEYVDSDLASEFHKSLKDQSIIVSKMFTFAKNKNV